MRYSTCIESPVGTLHAVADNQKLYILEFFKPIANSSASLVHDDLRMSFSDETSPIFQHLRSELDLYFTGKLTQFTVPIAPQGTPFQQEVWQTLRSIAYGTTVSYQDIARQIARPSASRAVGTANGANKIAIIIPCHRVITAQGTIGGYAGGVEQKRALLQLESQIRQK